jgi:NAD(P)-dependent dehydrogenase (short-subunit alcohol dehydrogenase family)
MSASHANTEATLAEQRRIQDQQDAIDASPQAKSSKSVPQTGLRPYPAPPFAEKHLPKPGIEAEMKLAPQFMAPDYRGSGKLEGRVALITGGDSGIGRAVAVLFAREGADVALFYLAAQADAEQTQRCVQAEGRRCELFAGDVKDAAWCERAVSEAVQRLGRLDVLVNNAAFQEHASRPEDITPERFDENLRTNIHGYFHMVRAALPHLEAGASIIQSGSVVGLRGSGQLLDYAASKGAIHAFTKSLASNLIERGIRVNAVAPGPVWTPLNLADKSPESVKHFGADTDFKRPAQPEELSPAYVFLAAPACSSYITGIVLPVTGSVEAV